MMHNATVMGAGLAGSEAAWQLAQRGMPVTLCGNEAGKRGHRPTHADAFAELVLLQLSLREQTSCTRRACSRKSCAALGSLIILCADATRVEAGGALGG